MKPNIIFILADDHSYFGIGKESPSVISPNLNMLADEGAYFKNCFCASPVCSPARASILTGMLPSAHGVHDWIISGNVDYDNLPDNLKNRPALKNNEKTAVDFLDGFTTYADILVQNGYEAALSGKWHLGDTVKKRKTYSYWNVLLRGGCSYKDYDLYNTGTFERHTEYVTDKITDNAVAYLKNRNKDKPFYLGIHYTAPHTPWDKKEHKDEIWQLYENNDFSELKFDTPIHPDSILHEYIGDTEEKRQTYIRGYFSAITGMDDNIGKIIKTLTELDLLENTLIVFTGDNGMNLGHHGVWGKGNGTYPQNFYEESVKVPLIFYHKGKIAPSVCTDLISHTDIFQTLLEYSGIDTNLNCASDLSGSEQSYPFDNKRPGKSFCPVFEGKSFSRTSVPIVSEYGAVRMLRTERYKLIQNYIDNRSLFFDLKRDPQEKNNCIQNAEYSSIINKMAAEIDSVFETYSLNEHDGRYQFPKGMGQIAKVRKTDGTGSFKQNIRMYWDKQK